MVAKKIETPREFFDYVVDLDVRDFSVEVDDLRAAYHACNSLLSLRDWVFRVRTHKMVGMNEGL
jgi:hypothetical protein